jgi:hypothetical protein
MGELLDFKTPTEHKDTPDKGLKTVEMNSETVNKLGFEYFHGRVNQHYRTTKTRKAAYELAEQEFQHGFGCRRYSGYNSFKVAQSRNRKHNKSTTD